VQLERSALPLEHRDNGPLGRMTMARPPLTVAVGLKAAGVAVLAAR
jgi:hypothetical protein